MLNLKEAYQSMQELLLKKGHHLVKMQLLGCLQMAKEVEAKQMEEARQKDMAEKERREKEKH